MKDVRPLDVWRRGAQDFSQVSSRSRKLAYESWQFINYASARAFTEIRDGFAKANEEKRAALASGDAGDAAKRPYIYSYALRSNTFLLGISALDFFEFYRHADNAMAWETSNRDSRVWQWDSYLTDVQRVLKREMGLETGIYVKPHRGAPIQRMIAAVSRANELIYWYTYGPDYWKGDAFSNDLGAMRLTSKAAHLLGAAEPYLHGAKSQRPRVAVVRPDATQAWMALEKKPETIAASENGKWIYTALQHAHVPVDPLDEKLLIELDPSRYAALYVSGTHVTRAAASALKSYVEKGGTLVTSGYGLAFDETNSPLTTLLPVLGLKKREALETWCDVPAYGAGQLASLAACEERHTVRAEGSDHALPLKVGREVLLPAANARVLARYEDGKVAGVESKFGKGKTIVLGYFAGVEYAAPIMRHEFNMRRDFDRRRRALVVGPALAAGPVPVELSDDLVEPVLLEAPVGGWAVTLVNWAYADAARQPAWTGLVKHVRHLPLGQLDILVRGVTARKVRSVALGRDLSFEQVGNAVRIALPELAEGDVLTIEPG